MMKNVFLLKKYFACTVFALFIYVGILVYCPSIVFLHFAKIAEASATWMRRMRDCCNRRRAFTHLDFSPDEGYCRILCILFCFQYYLITLEMKSL